MKKQTATFDKNEDGTLTATLSSFNSKKGTWNRGDTMKFSNFGEASAWFNKHTQSMNKLGWTTEAEFTF